MPEAQPTLRERPIVAYIALGSNLGDRAGTLRAARDTIASLEETRLLDWSGLYETAPVGVVDQPEFLNAACSVVTRLDAPDLLARLLAIEAAFGRDRSGGVRFGPRTLDLDLLLYGCEAIDLPGLRVPHPRMHERGFVLEPLAAIAPAALLPGLGTTVGDALRRLNNGA